MPYPGRNRIYNSIIERMVNEAFRVEEAAFAKVHGEDSDEQLLVYMKSCAVRLGHTPWPREIAGGEFLLRRFIVWENAYRKAGLPPPSLPDKLTCFARCTEETERQKKLYREKKTAQKESRRCTQNEK